MKRWLIIMLVVAGLLPGMSGAATAQDREAQLAEARQLIQQVMARYNAGRYDEAIPLAERALVLREKALGPEHPDVAAPLNNLAELYRVKGDYARAELLFQRALAILEKARGSEHPDVAMTLNNLAQSFSDRGDYRQAEPLFLRALAILEKARGPEHPDVALLLNNLAQLYRIKSNYARAEPLYQRALAILQKVLGPEHPDVATALDNLATLYHDKGDDEQAEPLYQRALEIRKTALGQMHPDVATSLNNVSGIYFAKGDYAQAESLSQRALAINEEVFGREHPNVARSLINLGSLYHRKGDYARAELSYQRALTILEKALGRGHADVARLLNLLTELYFDEGDYARAEPLSRRALAILEKVFGSEHPAVAIPLNNLASLYLDKGDYALAEPLLQRALAILKKALPPEHPDVANALNSLASLYDLKGDYTRAEPLYQQALAIREKALGPEHPDVASTLDNLASLYLNKGDYIQALRFEMRGNEVHERNLTLLLTAGSERQKQLYLNTLSSETSFAVSLHFRSMPQDGGAAQLALTTILQRKGRALDTMTNQVGILRRHATPQDQELLDQLAKTRSHLASLQISGESSLTPEVRQAVVARLNVEADRLEEEVSRSSTEFRVQTLPVTLETVRQAIPADAALVEMFLYRPHNTKAKNRAQRYGMPSYVAYVARHDEAVPQWVELGEAAVIDAEVERLRAALKDPKLADLQAIARAFDERVMRPIRKLLGSTRRLFLSPDGALNLIPFAALVDENGQYLIENYSLTYLTSGRDLLRLQAQAESRSGPVVLADPLYDMAVINQPTTNNENQRSVDFTLKTYPPLSGTAEEAVALSKLWPDAQVLTQDKATESALKQVSSPRILHVATHGFFLADQPQKLPVGNEPTRETIDTSPLSNASPKPEQRENPLLRSGLVLAGVKQQQSGAGEDGVLTALETAGLNLWGTKLVVLSACETGLGDVRNGAGVYGLRRALVLAGSQTQVMSLWKVSDAGTRDLMTSYYTRLQAGEGRTEALRQVQLAMLRGELKPAQDATDYRHPYYWAAFIPSGDWRSMDATEDGVSKTRSSLKLFAILAPVIGGIIVILVLAVRRLRSGSV